VRAVLRKFGAERCELLGRGEPLAHRRLGDLLERQRGKRLHGALEPARLADRDLDVLETGALEQCRNAWADIRVAAAPSGRLAVELNEAPVGARGGMAEAGAEVGVLDNDPA